MTVTIERESEIPLPFSEQEVAEAVISETLDYEDCPYEVQVNIILTTNEEIHQINLEQRGVDAPTDVLSFPMIEYAYPSDFTVLEADSMDNFDPDTGELILGDIVISVDKVIEQAEKYNHGVKREYAFLIAHSMLHLFGYDHMDEVERENMELRQDEILNRLNITR
ncbi:MAG: rRNA maturation RNase YbeY [Lachnospiraceae bacterium]|nr:rRNA maturation RNase YbeY [Lachnospiraceae bacterium]MEE1015250.1 rRNA maturation RNase YbeY [Lachnospiraceae bacterium]